MDSDREIAERRLGHLVGGKWRLERLLGTGGMAAVYAARSGDGAIAAVKMLHPEMTLKRDVRERFVREGYVGNKVQHPGAIKILEHGESEGEAYLVMELLEGEPLGERVRRLSGIPSDELLAYLDQVLDVLAAAHAQGIIHRDIKPDNLFVGSDGRVKILDFGLARMLDDVPGDFKTRTGLALGTLPYMAPEQALGKRGDIDGRVDVFALGATAFRILARRRVHEADSEAELLVAMATKPVPPLASVAPEVPKNVCAIIDLSLAFAKDSRYPDARTMQGDVRAVIAGQEPPYAVSRGVMARDLPTRVDLVAPVVPGSAEASAISGSASMPSVPHVIAAGARAASTAVMPAVVGTALPNEPTRADSPHANLGHAVTQPDPQPALSYHDAPPVSVQPVSAQPLSAAYPQTAYTVTAGTHPTSQPPPAKRSMLPLIVLLAGTAALFIVAALGLFLFSRTGDTAAASADAPPATSEPTTEATAVVETPPPPESETAAGSQKEPTRPSGAGTAPVAPAGTAAAQTAAKATTPAPPTTPTGTAKSIAAPTGTAAAPTSTATGTAATTPTSTSTSTSTSTGPGKGKGKYKDKGK